MDELTRLRGRSGMAKLDITQKIMFEQVLKEEYEIIERGHFKQRHMQRLRRKT